MRDRLVLILTLIFLGAPLQAIAPSGSCGKPFLFPAADVNLIVLPFQYVAGDSTALAITSDRLSLLVELEAFSAMLKYGSVGVVRLTQSDRSDPCDENEVLAKLLGEKPGGRPDGTLLPGKALVLLWGRLYEEGDDIYVQCYIRFLRPPFGEEISLKIDDLHLTGRLPSQAFPLAPRHLTQQDVIEIRDQFAKNAAASAPMPLISSEPLPGFVNGAWGEWLKADEHAGLSRRKLPDLDFVEGVIGYLRMRTGNDLPWGAERQAEAALRRYTKAADYEAESTAAAGAQALLGFLAFLRAPDPVAGLQAARVNFERAATLAPDSGEARNLSLMADFYSLRQGTGNDLRPREIARGLLNAASLDPENAHLRQNLVNFYRFLQLRGLQPGVDLQYQLPASEIETTLAVLGDSDAIDNIDSKLDPLLRIAVAEGGPAKGPANAPVTIVEFSDFQCPFCSRLATSIDEVKEKYGDQVRLVFRQYPQPMHPNAQKAAEASLCAGEQGKFWLMHDAMFEAQRDLSIDKLKEKAIALGLHTSRFDSCLDSGKYATQIEADMQAGTAAGVSGVPAIFINGRLISGAGPIESITAAIDHELKNKNP